MNAMALSSLQLTPLFGEFIVLKRKLVFSVSGVALPLPFFNATTAKCGQRLHFLKLMDIFFSANRITGPDCERGLNNPDTISKK